jgi:hypothetical protein
VTRRPPEQLNLFPSGVKISLPRAAELIGCSESTARRLLEEGAIDGYQLRENGWWIILLDSVVDYIRNIRKRYIPDYSAANEKATTPSTTATE